MIGRGDANSRSSNELVPSNSSLGSGRGVGDQAKRVRLHATQATATLYQILRARQSEAGGWGFGTDQDAIEPTCLAILALRNQPSAHVARALDIIANLQNKDGSWSALVGDEPEGCWTTA